MRAINQQLRAAEQQLIASNQQLKAKEDALLKSHTELEGSNKAYLNIMEDLEISQSMLKKWNEMLEEKVEEKTLELKESAAQLIQSEKLSALGELTAGVAHELNQPLNVMKIICQSILRDIKKDRFEKGNVEQDLPEIINQINKMAEIIDHMRIFSRRTEGSTKEKININTILENALKFSGQQIKDHNIELIKELSSDLPEIMGNPLQLEQVFLNLIINARNVLEEGKKNNKTILIKSFMGDRQKSIMVEIKDNGRGIPPEVKNKIFQPFYTTKAPGKGTGLGLSISNKIIEEHIGKIEVESEVGEGTTFRIILPVI